MEGPSPHENRLFIDNRPIISPALALWEDGADLACPQKKMRDNSINNPCDYLWTKISQTHTHTHTHIHTDITWRRPARKRLFHFDPSSRCLAVSTRKMRRKYETPIKMEPRPALKSSFRFLFGKFQSGSDRSRSIIVGFDSAVPLSFHFSTSCRWRCGTENGSWKRNKKKRKTKRNENGVFPFDLAVFSCS